MNVAAKLMLVDQGGCSCTDSYTDLKHYEDLECVSKISGRDYIMYRDSEVWTNKVLLNIYVQHEKV